MGRKSVPWGQEDQALSQKRETAIGTGIPDPHCQGDGGRDQPMHRMSIRHALSMFSSKI